MMICVIIVQEHRWIACSSSAMSLSVNTQRATFGRGSLLLCKLAAMQDSLGDKTGNPQLQAMA